MRTFEHLFCALLIGAGLLVGPPASALDGSKTDASVGPPPMTPMEAFRSGAHWLKAGDTVKAVNSLEYAAEKGHALAQWKLGRMYAEGDGVAQNDIKAFEYFRRIADSHAEDNPDTPQARFVANAFVALGHYYLEGISTYIKRDPERARGLACIAVGVGVKAREMVPDDLGRKVTLDALRAGIPVGHDAVRIEHIERVVDHAVDEQPELAFVVGKRL